jgi:hypothetical protein
MGVEAVEADRELVHQVESECSPMPRLHEWTAVTATAAPQPRRPGPGQGPSRRSSLSQRCESIVEGQLLYSESKAVG